MKALNVNNKKSETFRRKSGRVDPPEEGSGALARRGAWPAAPWARHPAKTKAKDATLSTGPHAGSGTCISPNKQAVISSAMWQREPRFSRRLGSRLPFPTLPTPSLVGCFGCAANGSAWALGQEGAQGGRWPGWGPRTLLTPTCRPVRTRVGRSTPGREMTRPTQSSPVQCHGGQPVRGGLAEALSALPCIPDTSQTAEVNQPCPSPRAFKRPAGRSLFMRCCGKDDACVEATETDIDTQEPR